MNATATARPVALAPLFNCFPSALRECHAWVLWRYELDERGRWTKVPYRADGGGKASTTAPKSWATLAAARAAYERGGFDGVGLVLTNGVAGVDADKCVTDAGEVEPWASDVLSRFKGTYRERSPSGRGYRIFLRGTPARCGKGGPENRVEVYAKDSPRYLTVTGHALDEEADIADMQPALDWLHAAHMTKANGAAHSVVLSSAGLSDDEVLDHARRARNGSKFMKLWAGSHARHASASEADAALVALLAFYTSDAAQIDRLVRRSGLYRRKWDERRGDSTYGAQTIERILAKPGARFGDGAGTAAGGSTRDTRASDVGEGQSDSANAAEGDSASAEWPEPQPIRAALHPVPLFDPVALLPAALRDWVMDEAERMPCAPDFVAAAAVVALGATIGARCAIKPKARDSWLVVPNLWGGIVALPSAKKSPAIGAAMAPVDRLAAQAQEAHRGELEAFETDRVVSEARRDAIKDAIKAEAKKPDGGNVEAKADELRRHKADTPQSPTLRRYRTNDATVEKLGEMLRDNPAGLLVLRDELVGLLASWDREGREGDRSFFLEAWNGTGSFDTDRIGRGSILIPNLCVSIFGGIQPDKLTEYLEQAAHALGNDGTLQRFQVLVYPDARPWEWRDRAPNKQARDAAFRLFELLANFDPFAWGAIPADDATRFPHFRFSDDAQQVFIEWLHELQRERIVGELADGHPLIAQHLAKCEKLFAALALILHLADCAATGQRGAVSVEAAFRAAAWCEYLEAHARRCYGLLADEGLRAAQALATRVERGVLADGFTARDVRRNGWRYLSSDAAVRAALDWLEDEGWLRGEASGGTGPGTGRRTDRYRINPKTREVANRGTAKTANRTLTAALAVPNPGVSEDLRGAAHV